MLKDSVALQFVYTRLLRLAWIVALVGATAAVCGRVYNDHWPLPVRYDTRTPRVLWERGPPRQRCRSELQALSNSLQVAYGIRRKVQMIDKLDVRIPCDTPFHPDFGKLYADLRYEPEKDPFHETRHYLRVADLRPYGYDVALHLGCKHGKHANHKLELFDTGVMPYSRIINEIERVFEMDARKAEVMRIDLATDVEEIPVRWFQPRVKATHKQCIANFGSAQLVEMGKGGIQTLYFGKRPNLFRIYDKHAEYKHQYAQILRKLGKDSEAPKFEDLFHVPENGTVITRVERQIGGRIPPELATVGDLVNLPNYRPFEPLKIVIGSALRFIAHTSKRNTKWVLEKFADFLPSDEEYGTPNLDTYFYHSVSRQLAA